ncbi:MAG: PorV/PorQ family protein [Ignavibacteria bacterium]|nr:PorV/PorQ family protein [Ignavibacteria bacterium]
MRKVFILLTLSFFISNANLHAQIFRDITKVGTTAGQFLKIGPGARALSMGGAYVGVSDDIYAVYYNPAGVAINQGNGQAAFSHTQWLADVNYDFAAASINVESVGTLFMSITSLRVSEEKVTTFEFPEGNGQFWDASSVSFGVGFARSLTDRFSIGFHAKYIQESIWSTSAHGFALDVGTYYVTPFNDLVIGASITNFGTKMQLDGRDIQINYDPNGNPSTGPNNVPAKFEMDQYDLPLTFRIGFSMDVFKSRYIRVKAAFDATHPNDNVEYANAGVEFAYDELLFIRGGYKSLFLTDSEQSLTLGAGLKYEMAPGLNINVNYGYGDYGRLKNIQYFDVGIIF